MAEVKLKGDYLPTSHIMDTPLLDMNMLCCNDYWRIHWSTAYQKAGSVISIGVLVSDGSNIFSGFEYQSLEQRIFQQLQLNSGR